MANQAHDVSIVLTHNRKYPFHASTLARSSVFFANMLTEAKAAKLGSRARTAGIKTRWMLELVKMPDDDHPAGELALVELSSTGERADGMGPRVVNENGRVPNKVFDHWEQVLYTFYGTEIRIADDDMGTALVDCIGIIEVAEYLGSVTFVGTAVEVALLKHGQALFRAIQAQPYSWADMSFRIRSQLIFREALIHLAGNWNHWKKTRECVETLRQTPAALKLTEKYNQRLVKKSQSLEHQLMTHYPGDLPHPRKIEPPIKRSEYSKDILVWMALTWYRHWLSQQIINSKGHHSDDRGYALFKVISTGGEAYMDQAVLHQFHTMFPLTKKAMNVVENHVCEIKECMKGFVKSSGLMKSYCQLNIEKFPVPYMTCVQFERKDFPWLRKEDEAKADRDGKRPGGNEIAKRNLECAKQHQKEREKLMAEGDLTGGDVAENEDAESDADDEESDADDEQSEVEDENEIDGEMAPPAKRARQQ